MSQNQNDEFKDFSDFSLIEDIPDHVSTDTVADLKTGIYNLFLNLYRVQIINLGPQQAMAEAIDFLEEIIYNFKQTLQE